MGGTCVPLGIACMVISWRMLMYLYVHVGCLCRHVRQPEKETEEIKNSPVSL